MKRRRTRSAAGFLSLAALLLTVALAVAACAQPAPSSPAAATAPAQPTTAAPATAAVAGTPTGTAGGTITLPEGVDAEGHFYRGDLNAPIKLVEFSDFQ